MKKLYYLKTCSTCQRIVNAWNIGEDCVVQDIKTQQITEEQIDEMAKLAGSYEALFSRRSMKYRPMGLHEKELSEQDYRALILKEYTFLKRPVLIINDQIFVGNTKNMVVNATEALLNLDVE